MDDIYFSFAGGQGEVEVPHPGLAGQEAAVDLPRPAEPPRPQIQVREHQVSTIKKNMLLKNLDRFIITKRDYVAFYSIKKPA